MFSFVHKKEMTIEKKLRALFILRNILVFYVHAKYVLSNSMKSERIFLVSSCEFKTISLK